MGNCFLCLIYLFYYIWAKSDSGSTAGKNFHELDIK